MDLCHQENISQLSNQEGNRPYICQTGLRQNSHDRQELEYEQCKVMRIINRSNIFKPTLHHFFSVDINKPPFTAFAHRKICLLYTSRVSQRPRTAPVPLSLYVLH